MTLMLTPDQYAGAQFLMQSRVAYLADVPGLGKTAQYIRALDLLGADAATVICPPILRAKLADEIALWSRLGHDVTVINTAKDVVPETGLVAVSYALASVPDMMAKLRARKRGPLICDEAHALKEPSSQRTLAILSNEGLARWATHTWLVSGTPMPNHAGELFVFMRLCGAWRASWEAYQAEFCQLAPATFAHRGNRMRIVGSKNEKRLTELLAPHWLRRTCVEGRPALSLDTIGVEGSDAFAGLDPIFCDEILAAVDSGDYTFSDLDHIATIRRLAGIAKIKPTIELARNELETHRKVLIFGTHIKVLQEIAAGLKDYGAVCITGQTKARDADEWTRDFQDSASAMRVIVGNMQRMGEGLTLTEASRVLIAEPSWTPKDNEQALARAWRRGQKRPVHTSYVCLAGSIDEAISKTLVRKSRSILSAIG